MKMATKIQEYFAMSAVIFNFIAQMQLKSG